VGHKKRIKIGISELMHGFWGKLKVVGSSYTGVRLNDCLRAARDVGIGIKRGGGGTGLEGFVEWLGEG
jgi:protoporphyrinogen/coproporphyrinogen III oxidase